MDADTYDRTSDLNECVARGGGMDDCRIEAGLATEDDIANEQSAQRDAIGYVTRLVERATASNDPVQRLAALELAVALRSGTVSGPAVLDAGRLEAAIGVLSTGLETRLGHDPDLLAGLLHACQGLPCETRALARRVEDLEPYNLHWLTLSGHPLHDDSTALVRAAAAADRFNDRQWDAARRIARLMETSPPPQSLLAPSQVGPDGVPPRLLAFVTAFALASDLDAVTFGSGPLARACGDSAEDLRESCFAIGELKYEQGSTQRWRRVGAEMMQAAAWNDETRDAASHAARVLAWQLEQQSTLQAASDRNALVAEVGYMREVVMEEGATEVELLIAQLARAGIALEPPAPQAE